MKTMVAAMLEGSSVQQALLFALAELDARFPRDMLTEASELAKYDPQTLADDKLTPKFGIDQWIARPLVIRAAIGRYYESSVGFDGRESFAQSMYEAMAQCHWSSPYTEQCHEIAEEYGLRVVRPA
ncbi:MAG: hypothetical protein ACF8K1_01320 [Phycisphaerales bacterium JB047]